MQCRGLCRRTACSAPVGGAQGCTAAEIDQMCVQKVQNGEALVQVHMERDARQLRALPGVVGGDVSSSPDKLESARGQGEQAGRRSAARRAETARMNVHYSSEPQLCTLRRAGE